jgi:integrase
MTTHDVSPLALVPAATSAAPLALTSELESARGYARASKAPETRRAYAREWHSFEAWCAERGATALPCSADVLACYVASMADAGRKPAGIDAALAAVSAAHAAGGHDGRALRASPAVRAVRAGVRRTVGTAQRQAAPATVEVVRAMLDACPGEGPAIARDIALLLVGFAGAFRRSELVALDVADLTFTARGVEVVIRRSKTDQEGAGRTVAIPLGSQAETCPVRRLQAWLTVAGIVEGPVFRSVDRWRKVGGRIDGRDVARIVKRAADRAGFDAAVFSGHSLRAGLATSAALAGKSDRAIMATTGHKSRAMVDRYVRSAERWRDNAAAGLL